MTFQLYIGANNTTKRLQIGKLKQVLNKNHQGFTIQRTIGAWQGVQEQSAIVLIEDKPSKVKKTVQELKTVLRQQAIGVQRVPQIRFE